MALLLALSAVLGPGEELGRRVFVRRAHTLDSTRRHTCASTRAWRCRTCLLQAPPPPPPPAAQRAPCWPGPLPLACPSRALRPPRRRQAALSPARQPHRHPQRQLPQQPPLPLPLKRPPPLLPPRLPHRLSLPSRPGLPATARTPSRAATPCRPFLRRAASLWRPWWPPTLKLPTQTSSGPVRRLLLACVAAPVVMASLLDPATQCGPDAAVTTYQGLASRVLRWPGLL